MSDRIICIDTDVYIRINCPTGVSPKKIKNEADRVSRRKYLSTAALIKVATAHAKAEGEYDFAWLFAECKQDRVLLSRILLGMRTLRQIKKGNYKFPSCSEWRDN